MARNLTAFKTKRGRRVKDILAGIRLAFSIIKMLEFE